MKNHLFLKKQKQFWSVAVEWQKQMEKQLEAFCYICRKISAATT